MDIGKLAGDKKYDSKEGGSRSVRALHYIPRHLDSVLKTVATPVGF